MCLLPWRYGENVVWPDCRVYRVRRFSRPSFLIYCICCYPVVHFSSLACPSSADLAISLHISGIAHKRGPRRGLAWVGLIEPLYHRHLSSCKHSSREREPGCCRHCHVILIPIISLFLFLFRPAAGLTSDSTKSIIFGFFFSLHLLDWCELARLSCTIKCKTRWHLIWAFVVGGLAWDFGPCKRSQTGILRVPPADNPIRSYT